MQLEDWLDRDYGSNTSTRKRRTDLGFNIAPHMRYHNYLRRIWTKSENNKDIRVLLVDDGDQTGKVLKSESSKNTVEKIANCKTVEEESSEE